MLPFACGFAPCCNDSDMLPVKPDDRFHSDAFLGKRDHLTCLFIVQHGLSYCLLLVCMTFVIPECWNISVMIRRGQCQETQVEGPGLKVHLVRQISFKKKGLWVWSVWGFALQNGSLVTKFPKILYFLQKFGWKFTPPKKKTNKQTNKQTNLNFSIWGLWITIFSLLTRKNKTKQNKKQNKTWGLWVTA